MQTDWYKYLISEPEITFFAHTQLFMSHILSKGIITPDDYQFYIKAYTNVYDCAKSLILERKSEKLLDLILEYGARTSNFELVKLSIEYGADVNKNDFYAMLTAIGGGKNDIVKLLIDNGADINSVTNNTSALCTAIRGRNYETVKLLLENGSDVSVHNEQPIILASMYGLTDIVALLLDCGADIHATNYYDYYSLIMTDADFHANKDFSLSVAATNGHFNVVKLLLERGISANADGCNALMSAAQRGHHLIVKLLLENGADVHALEDNTIKIAADMGHYEVIRILLEYGADVHGVNDYALLASVQYGYDKCVGILLENGADVHVNNNEAIKTAVGLGYEKIIKILLEYGADPTYVESIVD